jgi:two-component system sensor histidine kinase BaeS
MKLSLRTELIISFTLIGLLSIGIIFVFVNFFLENQFKEYSIRRQENQNLEMASSIEKQIDRDGKWNVPVIQEIGVRGLEQGLIIRVTDVQDRPVWDALAYNSGICHSMIEKMSTRMSSHYQSLNGGLTHKDYPLLENNRPVGILRIGYYGPFFYTDADFFYIETINRILLWVMFGTLLLSVLAGILVSSRLTAPMALVIESAKRIQGGDFSTGRTIRSSTREVVELVGTMDTLAANLGNQERLRRQLTQDVAHELRTPLATLQSHLEAMVDGVWEPTKERLSGLHNEILRLAGLVKNMGTLTHYESENFTLEKTGFSLKELAARILLLHEPEMKKRKLGYSLSGSEAFVSADRNRIAEVIGNLLENAIEFTPENGKIALATVEEPGRVRLTVSDTGIGIPASDTGNIFERFYRVDKSRTRSRGGAGIGLAIVKQIVNAHNGTIEVTSELGKGSAFTVTLPA